MRRANQDLEALTSALATQLANARDTYADALRMSHSPHPMSKVLRLFERETYGEDGQISVQAYQPVSPGVALGFEQGKGEITVLMRPSASQLSDDPEVCDCEIVIENGSASGWLTLELDVDPRYLRPSSTVSLSIFGSVDLPESDLDQDACKVDLFCFDVDGKRHSLTRGKVPFAMPLDYGQARADFRAALPGEVRIDFDRPMVLVIFFAPQATRIGLTDFYVAFS